MIEYNLLGMEEWVINGNPKGLKFGDPDLLYSYEEFQATSEYQNYMRGNNQETAHEKKLSLTWLRQT